MTSPEAGQGKCLPYVLGLRRFPASQEDNYRDKINKKLKLMSLFTSSFTIKFPIKYLEFVFSSNAFPTFGNYVLPKGATWSYIYVYEMLDEIISNKIVITKRIK